MTIQKAIKLLMWYHEKAENNAYIRKPVAWALYQVWKEADKEETE